MSNATLTSKILFKTLVGSRAHGTADADSDYDYRGVFIASTRELLSPFRKVSTTHWIEGKTDDTSFEVGEFLRLATHCNPTILEIFKAPALLQGVEGYVDDQDIVNSIRNLFPHVWTTKKLIASHLGYGGNQRKKFFEDEPRRKTKFACAWLRTTYQAYSLLAEGNYPVELKDTPIFPTLMEWRSSGYEFGQVVDTCLKWESKLKALEDVVNPDFNITEVEARLWAARRYNW